jgi:AraC-like DNA-binding protein/ligand-binding sensor protein
MFNLAGLLNIEIVKNLLEEFHRASGLNTILKTDYGDVVAVFVNEQKDCGFCKLIYQSNSGFACYASDQKAMEKARETRQPLIYTCHAGLTDAVIPLFVADRIIGAVMTGQVYLEPGASIPFSELGERHHLDPGALRAAFDDVVRMSQTGFTFLVNNLFWMLNYIISIEADFHNLFQSDSSHAREKIDAAVAIVNARFAEPLNIQEVASEVGFSAWHFSALFKKYTNYSFRDFLNRVRVGHAAFLLKSTFKTVTEIAFDAGYSDSNYFSTAFKKMTGLSPSEYRAQGTGSALPDFKKKEE